MPDWAVAGLAVVGALLGGGGLGALLSSRAALRAAGAQETTAAAATETARAAGQKVAGDVLDAHTREWQALLATAQSQVATAQNLLTTVGAQNETLKADLAALNLKHTQDMGEVKEALAECHALNRAIAERVDAVKAEARGRLASLERGQYGG